MTMRIMKLMKRRSFSVQSEKRLYVALSLGILISMMPISEIKWFLIPLFSLAFSLNLLIMMVGVSLITLFPMVFLLSYGIATRISTVPLDDFSSKSLSIEMLLQWTPGSLPFLIGSILGGILISLSIFPLYYYIQRRDTVGENTSYAVFHDASGKRLRTVNRTRLILALGLPVVVLFMGFALNEKPSLPEIELDKSNEYIDMENVENPSIAAIKERDKIRELPAETEDTADDVMVESDQMADHQVFAFYSQKNLHSRISLEENFKEMDVLIPDWFSLSEDMALKVDVEDEVILFIEENGISSMPQVHNMSDDNWDPLRVSKLISSKEHTNEFITSLIASLKSTGSSGVTLDFENLMASDKDVYTAFIRTISEKLHQEDLLLGVTIPAGELESYDAEAIAGYADYLMLLIYDESYSSSESGPVASQPWVEERIEKLGEIDKEKIVPIFGSYGYNWKLGDSGSAQFMSFSDVLLLARKGNLKIQWHEEEMNPYFLFQKEEDDHVVWFLDAATLYNGMQHVLSKGISNIGLFALGTEDAGIWSYIAKGQSLEDHTNGLKELEGSTQVQYEDLGDILRIKDTLPRTGRRNLQMSGGRITGEQYEVYPNYYEVEKYGLPEGKKVALTFDDGPSRKFTPQILDILSEHSVPSTFFVIGINALSNKELLARIYDEGHEIGNHTFTHPDISKISDLRLKYELSFTQRIIQDVTGKSTLMFRPPGGLNAYSVDQEDYLPIMKTQELGYTVVGNSIDPKDWDEPTSIEIYDRVMEEVPEGNVILLHDSGGDMANTVEALPRIILELKRQGYEFVTVSSLIGKTRDEVMPAVERGDSHFIMYTKSAMDIVFGILKFMGYVFLFTTILGAIRLLVLVILSKKQHRRVRREIRDMSYKPPVSVVIAAYNEEKVIVSTVLSVLESTYEHLEIIVVNDGSTDGTSRVMEEAFRDHPKVILLEKTNGGKSTALNMGFRKATGEIVVAFDADTQVNKEAISLMIRHFKDESVGAVSGNVRVGNVHNLLTRWQYIEYVIGFNLERRAFAELNCITVVPGAIGAWRKDYVAECGYYTTDTLAEDTDMTIKLLREGYGVKYEESALAYTEAPGDLKSLMKQRYRWSFGILQALWKHRDMMFSTEHKTLGFIALPNMWLFQYILQTLSPLADLILILGLFSSRAPIFITYYAGLLILDYITALYAFRLEKVNPGILVWLFLQRIIYRSLMVYINIKAIFNAMKGMQVGWNKFKRKGDVKKPVSV